MCIRDRYCLVIRDLIDGIQPDNALVRSFAKAADVLGESERGELSVIRDYAKGTCDGYVVDCFWSAWDAFRSSDSYEETIVRAIRYGNDTDTTAAVAGGLAGACWGVEGIPSKWLAGMRGHESSLRWLSSWLSVAGRLIHPVSSRATAAAGVSSSAERV